LLEQWVRLGVRDGPPVEAIPLGVEPVAAPSPLPLVDATQGWQVLCVGTLEGRKNHLALLEAAEALWREGRRFRLVLAGLPRPETAGPALRLAAQLRAAGRPLAMLGAVPDARLRELYAECHFTVYPSVYEGFGLPVAESLSHGRPCVCGRGGALAEVAGEGCLAVAEPTPVALAAALRALMDEPNLLTRLGTEAARRRFPSWADYARRVADWVEALRPHRRS
jgi:glycosyltransferase involved in cell wall biosynthesis